MSTMSNIKAVTAAFNPRLTTKCVVDESFQVQPRAEAVVEMALAARTKDGPAISDVHHEINRLNAHVDKGLSGDAHALHAKPSVPGWVHKGAGSHKAVHPTSDTAPETVRDAARHLKRWVSANHDNKHGDAKWSKALPAEQEAFKTLAGKLDSFEALQKKTPKPAATPAARSGGAAKAEAPKLDLPSV